MHSVFCDQLRHGAFAFHGFKRNTSLEAGIVGSALRHRLFSSFLETSRRQIVAYVSVQFPGRCSGARVVRDARANVG